MAAAALPKVVAQFKKIAPLANRVLIKKADPITQTKGGIVLPDQTKTRIHRGTAIAVGPGGRNDNGQVIPMQVKPGDDVLLPDYGATKVELEKDEVYFIYRETEILATIPE
ncbi:unnamed protein product [Acanthoscelides obtectus]|uniref:10 kDa heat shock protein, mitochondrial n=1 Tax=Acanthoscelides obtectus TaxID=200917 RepID=A0A9P0PKB7_ACAOB|nr:unnamed protein product [Acanthoscelides obtectus]CAK1638886.1 10 kDa heat shock protein, mitochondrial [Acanthoscelides obtectus]